MVDLDAIAAVVGDARVVGLGEGLHAVGDVYRMKDEVFRFLVEEHGFRFFVLESGFPEGLLVDDWINRRTDAEIDDVLRRGFTYNMGCCEEFVAQLEWMRSWNDDHPDDPVRYFGTDLPAWLDSDQPALDAATAFLARVDSDVEVPTDVDDLVALLARLEPEYAGRSDRESAAIATRAAEVARSWRDFKRSGGDGSLRDLTMAQTVLWVLRVFGPSSRILFGAHNGHLQRVPLGALSQLPAGRYLAHHLGVDYVPIGNTYGAADGFGIPEAIGEGLGIDEHGFGQAEPDTVDHVMSQRGDGAVVDLRRETVDAPRMRLQAFAITIDVAAAFDALVHTDQVSFFHPRSLDRPGG